MKAVRLYFYCMWWLNQDKLSFRYWWHSFVDWVRPYLTLKMIPIVLTLWLITNGIWYFIAFSSYFSQGMVSFARWYLVFLYSPLALEKPLIIFLAIRIYKNIYRGEFKKKSNIIDYKYSKIF